LSESQCKKGSELRFDGRRNQRDKNGIGERIIKSDIQLAEERIKRLEREVKLFQIWFEQGGDTRRRILKKIGHLSGITIHF
jgi:archaellum component FlaC